MSENRGSTPLLAHADRLIRRGSELTREGKWGQGIAKYTLWIPTILAGLMSGEHMEERR